jgi:hypothetical protein
LEPSIRERKNINVQVASNSNLEVKKIGTVYIEDKNSEEVICLKDYHQAPGLTKEMTSLGKSFEDGWKPEFLLNRKSISTRVNPRLFARKILPTGCFIYRDSSVWPMC